MSLHGDEPASVEPTVKLRALSPAPLDSERGLPEGGLIIGRDPELADVVLFSSRVSRRHCRIQATAQGWEVEDLDSTNGVFLNGQPVDGRQALKVGDAIGLGRAEPPDFELAASDGGLRSLTLAPAERWTIGRALDCDITLPADPTVSQHHAELRCDGERLSILDPGSLNGVRIDGRALPRGRPHVLEEDQWLELGNSRLAVLPLNNGGILVTLAGRSPGLHLQARAIGDAQAGVDHLDLDIEPGSLAGIAASDPCRASVLLDLLAGRRAPDHGYVMHDGVVVRPTSQQAGLRIGHVGALLPLDEGLTVWQHLHYSAELRLPTDMARARRKTLLATTLAELGLGNLRNVKLARLDAGNRRLVAIAAELVTRPSLLCLDNPLDRLDPGQAQNLLKRLRQLTRTGTTVILGGIDPDEVEQVDCMIDSKAKPTGDRAIAEPLPAIGQSLGHRHERMRLHRIRTLLERQCRLRLRDPGTLMLYLLLPILLTLAATALAGPTVPIAHVMMMVAMATTVFTAAPEIGADRVRLRHEVRAGILPGEDLLARVLFLWLVGLGQVLVAGSGMAWLSAMNLNEATALLATMALVCLPAAALGLMIGAIDPTRARLVMPLAAGLIVLQWIVVIGSAPDEAVSGWLFGRIRELLPAWWGKELFAASIGGFDQEVRRAIRAAAFLVGQVITWMLIARALLGRRLR